MVLRELKREREKPQSVRAAQRVQGNLTFTLNSAAKGTSGEDRASYVALSMAGSGGAETQTRGSIKTLLYSVHPRSSHSREQVRHHFQVRPVSTGTERH